MCCSLGLQVLSLRTVSLQTLKYLAGLSWLVLATVSAAYLVLVSLCLFAAAMIKPEICMNTLVVILTPIAYVGATARALTSQGTPHLDLVAAVVFGLVFVFIFVGWGVATINVFVPPGADVGDYLTGAFQAIAGAALTASAQIAKASARLNRAAGLPTPQMDPLEA
jgi:hypothetical protein